MTRLGVTALVLFSLGAIGCSHGVTLRPIAPGVWLHVTTRDGFGANGLLVEGDHASILVDSGYRDADAAHLLAFAARRHRPVAALIVSHAHDDRIGGAGLIQRRGVPVYGLARTIAHARERHQTIPDRAVRDGDTVSVGGLSVTVGFVGPGHSDDNLIVWVPSARVLFGGCLVKSAVATDLGNVAEPDLVAWSRAIATLRTRFPDALEVVPGHGPLGGDALGHTLTLIGAAHVKEPAASASLPP
jgi:glyoxylase-like metal-dependent hydrolase (beta-lactamase superfamily II)